MPATRTYAASTQPRHASTGAPPAAKLARPPTDDTPIWDLFLSPFAYPTLTVADEMGVFALLADGSATAAEIAGELGIGARSSEALLGGLAAQGLLERTTDGYTLGSAARTYLLPDSPFYWGPMLHFHRRAGLNHDLLRSAIEADRPSASIIDEAWDPPAGPAPEMLAAITHAMHSHSLPAAIGVAERIDFTGVARLLDIAGGSGCFCIAVGQAQPDMRFTVVELPLVCPIVDDYAERHGLAGRIESYAADMFRDPLPDGHDGIFLSNVLHDWDDARCRALLDRAFAALPPGGRLFVHEQLLDEDRAGPATPMAFSMAMLTYTEGKQRTANEISDLLREAGFSEGVKVTPTWGYYSVVEAVRPA